MEKQDLVRAALMGIALAAGSAQVEAYSAASVTLAAGCGSCGSEIAASCGGASSCGSPKPKNNSNNGSSGYQNRMNGQHGCHNGNKNGQMNGNGNGSAAPSEDGKGPVGNYSYPIPSRGSRVLAEMSDDDVRKVDSSQNGKENNGYASSQDDKKTGNGNGGAGCPGKNKTAKYARSSKSGAYLSQSEEDTSGQPVKNGNGNGDKDSTSKYARKSGYVSQSDDMKNGNGNGNGGMLIIISEEELLPQLDAQGQAIYNSLDPTGKALARKYASPSSVKDKNQAVRQAAQEKASQKASDSFFKY